MAVTTQDLVTRAKSDIREVSPDEAEKRLGKGAVALDVRDDHEVEAGHLPNAVHITRGCLEFQIGDNDATRDPATGIVVYCKAGGRAALAAKTLQDMGYTQVVSIQGGYDGWVQAGKPVSVPGTEADEEE